MQVTQKPPAARCSSPYAPCVHRPAADTDPVETKEWMDAFRGVLETSGVDRARFLIEQLRDIALTDGLAYFCPRNTPYVNTIPVSLQPPHPGDSDLEQSITNLIRWNALCMVSQANEKEHGIGGHIATFASAATLYEVAFHHFFKGPDHPDGPDLVYFQGHASPGIYARAFLEGLGPAASGSGWPRPAAGDRDHFLRRPRNLLRAKAALCFSSRAA
jgi:pyruvate dehydrogenase E1 component